MKLYYGLKQNVLWIAAATIIVIVFATMYGITQQILRFDANSPQIQIAQDVAAQLDTSVSPETAVASMPAVNISRSLATFVNVYDKNGTPIAGSGKLDGKLLRIPAATITVPNGADYHAATLQPNTNNRFAIVSVAADKYYVVSGRSLREVEKNEMQALYITSIGEIGSLLIIVILYLTTGRKRQPEKSHTIRR